jgi:guanylate kinase
MSVPEFRKRIEKNECVEWEEVYKDLLYGTLKSELERIWADGHYPIFDVDAKGGITLKKIFGTESISIFILPPSVEELENRLIKRGTEVSYKIRMRVSKAGEEMDLANQFDNVIINHNLDKAKEEALKIVSSFLER